MRHELSSIKSLLKFYSERSFIPFDILRIDDWIINDSIIDFYGDYTRWYPLDNRIDPNKLILTPQLSTLLCYRIAHMINRLKNNDLNIQMEADVFSLLGRQIGQIEIFYSADIGCSFKINHGVGSVIGARCKIGDRCTIHQNCTIGDRKGGRPVIGNDVIIYAGSMILGNVYIGDRCIIGANSIVTQDCPSGSIIVGSPGKIIKRL